MNERLVDKVLGASIQERNEIYLSLTQDEKYALGEVIITTKFNDIIFIKNPVSYKNNLYVPKNGEMKINQI